MKKILIFSSVHSWNDGRIFFREAKTLSNFFKIELHAVADFKSKTVDGITIFGLPRWNKFSDRIRNILILWIRISSSKADYYHFHDPELLVLVPLIKILKRKPIIFDVHEHYPLMIIDKKYIPLMIRKFISTLYIAIEKITLQFIDLVFYTTNKVGERYKNFKNERAIQISNVPLRKIFNKEPPIWSKRKKRAIFLGNMTAIRGIREIILAFSIVQDRHKDYELYLIGKFYSESFKKEIIDLLKKLKLENIVKIGDEFSYLEISDILYDFRIGFVTFLSYPNNIMCLPNKIFEYMGAGLVTIASNFENYEKIILKNKCGIVVEPENYYAIADAFLDLVENEKRSEEFSVNARKAFMEKFHWEREEKTLLAAYHSLDI